LDKTHYSSARKTELREAFDRNNESAGNFKTTVNGFLKREAYGEIGKYPRLINARCDSAKVALGPSTKLMEEYVY